MPQTPLDDAALLGRIPGLRDLPARDRSVFLAHAHPISFDADVVFIEEGQAADCAFLLLDGTCRAEVARDGGVQVVGRIRPGAMVGEVGLFCVGTRRGATVRAETPVRLLLLSRELLAVPAAQPVLRRLERRALGDVAERVRSSSRTRVRVEREAAELTGAHAPVPQGGGFFARLRDRWLS